MFQVFTKLKKICLCYNVKVTLNGRNCFWLLIRDPCLSSPVANASNQLVLPRRDDSLSLKVIPLSVAQTCACMLSHSGFSRQEYWSGLPFPPPGNLPDSGIGPKSPETPALADGFPSTVPPGKPVAQTTPDPTQSSVLKIFPSPLLHPLEYKIWPGGRNKTVTTCTSTLTKYKWLFISTTMPNSVKQWCVFFSSQLDT